MAAPVFRGLHSLLRVVDELLNRPKWSRVATAGMRGDRPLPLICLIGASRAEKFVTALAQHLEDTAPPNQLFAEVGPTAAGATDNAHHTEHGPALVPLLEVLRDRLTEDRFGDQRIRRFRYFNLVNELTRQQDPAELFTAWRGRRRAGTEGPPAQAVVALPAWVQAVVAVFVAWHRPVRFWLWSHRCGRSGGSRDGLCGNGSWCRDTRPASSGSLSGSPREAATRKAWTS